MLFLLLVTLKNVDITKTEEFNSTQPEPLDSTKPEPLDSIKPEPLDSAEPEPLESTSALEKAETVFKYDIDCSAIYEMEPVEVYKSLVLRQRKIAEDTDESLASITSDCPLFIRSRGYDDVYVTEEERNFPLAYSMVVHKDAWMVERLLRASYSPVNIYCIHYDEKSKPKFISAMKGLARCLPNVFITSKTEFVTYATIARLRADLNCLSDLLWSTHNWKYVINVCGQDLPLKTNFELVSELKKLNGSNMLETITPSGEKPARFTFHHTVKKRGVPVRTEEKKDPPPHNIQMFCGNAYFILSRDFITYVKTSNVASDFLAWSEDTYSPDEHFWATLVRIPGVPGEVPRSHPDITDQKSRTRAVKWNYLEGILYPTCTGKSVRSTCIYGAAEMNWLLNDGHWFANKFDPKVDPIIIQCLEEKLQERQKMLQSASSQT